MGIMTFLVVLLMATNVWLYMEIRQLRLRADDMDEDLEITWTWCDTHAKEHVRANDRIRAIEEEIEKRRERDDLSQLAISAHLEKLDGRMQRVEEGLDITEDGTAGEAQRQERLFFDGMNNILNYTYDQARKAAADE